MPRIDKFTEFLEIERPSTGHFSIPKPEEFFTIKVNGTPDRVLFQCPCGCGHSLCLPVRAPGSPHPEGRSSWEYKANGLLIFPSVRDVGTCYAHFFIRADGTVDWCGDSGKK